MRPFPRYNPKKFYSFAGEMVKKKKGKNGKLINRDCPESLANAESSTTFSL